MAGLRGNNKTQNAQWPDYVGSILRGTQPINQLVPQHPYLKDVPGLEDFQFEKTQHIMVLTIPEALRLLTDRAANLFNAGYTEASKHVNSRYSEASKYVNSRYSEVSKHANIGYTEASTYVSTHSTKQIALDVIHLYDDVSKKGIDYFSIKDTVEWMRFSRNIMTSYDQAGNLAWQLGAIYKVSARKIIANGTTYIIITGYAGLRQILKGTRYLFNNAQMLEFGIGRKGMMDKAFKGMKYNIWVSAAFHALEFAFDSEYGFVDFFVDVPMDVAKLIITNYAMSMTAGLMTLLGAPVIIAGLVVLAVALLTVLFLEWLDSPDGLDISEAIKKAINENMEVYGQQIAKQAKTLSPGKFMLLRTMTHP